MSIERLANERWVRSLFNQSRRWRCAAVILVSFCMIAYLAWRDAAWVDESGHLGAGCHAWATGRFELYRVNPPLVRLLATIPIVISEVPVYADSASDVLLRQSAEGYVDRRVHRAEWEYGETLRRSLGDAFPRFLLAGRMMLVVFFVGTALLVAHWARRLAGSQAGVVALVAWCFFPEALNWGARITPDSAVTFAWLLTWFCAWRCTYRSGMSPVVTTAMAWGLSLLIKTSSVVLVPLVFFGWVSHAAIRRQLSFHLFVGFVLKIGLITVIGLCVLNLAYGWNETLLPIKEFEFASERLSGLKSGVLGNRFRGSWIGELPSPLPRVYLQGIDLQKAHFDAGGYSYFNGWSSERGWWWYYLAAVPLKTPVGFLLLSALALVLAIFKFCAKTIDRFTLANSLFVVLPVVFLFLMVSSQTGHTRNVRYLLPCVPLVIIVISQLVVHARWRRLVWAALLLSTMETAIAFPHMFNYCNFLAGGPKGAHQWFRASSYSPNIEQHVVERWLVNHPAFRPARSLSSADLINRFPLAPDARHTTTGEYVLVTRITRAELNWPVSHAVAQIGCTRLVYFMEPP